MSAREVYRMLLGEHALHTVAIPHDRLFFWQVRGCSSIIPLLRLRLTFAGPLARPTVRDRVAEPRRSVNGSC